MIPTTSPSYFPTLQQPYLTWPETFEASTCANPPVTFSYTGSITSWVVPATGSYTITAVGAQGGGASGIGGLGASMQGVFSLTAGQTLTILVGQQGIQTGSFPSGGGGTFVALGASYTTATPLIVAAGGAGVNPSGAGTSQTIIGGQITQSAIGSYVGAPGYGASAAPCCGGAGGFYSAGGTDTSYGFPGAQGFQQGGAGAIPSSSYSGYDIGGFGGGGTADFVGSCNTYGGPGGGYSGGSGNNGNVIYYGNGGGSFNGGTSQINSAAVNSGNGFVTITSPGFIYLFYLQFL